MLEKVTNKARSAFVLALAEQAKSTLSDMPDTVILIDSALSKAWEWIEGKTVSGDAIYWYIAREDDEGIAFELEKATTDANKCAINTALTAVCYVNWLVYKDNKSNIIPEAICEVSEDAIGLTVNYFLKCQDDNSILVEKLMDVCGKYTETNGNAHDQNISRAEFINA